MKALAKNESAAKDPFLIFLVFSICLHAVAVSFYLFPFQPERTELPNENFFLEFEVEPPVRIKEINVKEGEREDAAAEDQQTTSLGLISEQKIMAGEMPDEAVRQDKETKDTSFLKRGSGIRLRYEDLIRAKISRNRKYPEEARENREEGEVCVMFSVISSGKIIYSGVTSSSGIGILDDEALSTVRRSSPLPPIPRELGVINMTFEVPIIFSLNNAVTTGSTVYE